MFPVNITQQNEVPYKIIWFNINCKDAGLACHNPKHGAAMLTVPVMEAWSKCQDSISSSLCPAYSYCIRLEELNLLLLVGSEREV